MTRLTACLAAVLGASLATNAVAAARYRDSGPDSGFPRHGTATRKGEPVADDNALDRLLDHDSAHERRNGTCAYPNYYGMYPKYYVDPDGRGHFCDSWTPSNFGH